MTTNAPIIQKKQDKTGTLTLNKMVIQEDCPIYTPGMDQREVLRMAALAARWREPPRDALDTLVLTQADLPSMCVFCFLSPSFPRAGTGGRNAAALPKNKPHIFFSHTNFLDSQHPPVSPTNRTTT